ncbi:MAG: methyltransferase, partial [Acinetobacter faecalis]
MSQLANLSVQEQQFLETFQQALETQGFDRLIFSQYKGELEQLEKINLRVILLQNEQFLSCLYKYKTQDVTKNFPIKQAMDVIVDLLNVCKQANLITSEQELQLKKNKKKVMLS